MTVLPVVVRSETVAQEIEVFPLRISQSGLRFVYGETEPGHDLPRPRQSLFRVSATEDDKVVGIVHDMRSVRFTAPLVSPVPEKAVHVAVGEQWADHPALRRSTGTLLAASCVAVHPDPFPRPVP